MSESRLRRTINGPNHDIYILAGHVRARVFRRPDTSLAQGAQFAREFVDTMCRLGESLDAPIAYAVINVIDAPSVAGQKTRTEMSRLAQAWERAGRPLVIVVGREAIKDVQYRALLAKHAPTRGRVAVTESEAHAAARAMIAGP